MNVVRECYSSVRLYPSGTPTKAAWDGLDHFEVASGMSSIPDEPIPADASHVFGEALILLVQWRGGADEPTVTLDGQSLRISVIFNRVANLRYLDALPRGMLDLLLGYARRDPTRHAELTALTLTPTYETAARCLLRWFNEKFMASKG
jgi:hypothetical protein